MVFPVNTPTSPAVAVPLARRAAAPLGVTPPPEPLLAAGAPGRAERTGRVSAGRATATGLSLRTRRALLHLVLPRATGGPAPGSRPGAGPGPAGGAGRPAGPFGGPCGRHLPW